MFTAIVNKPGSAWPLGLALLMALFLGGCSTTSAIIKQIQPTTPARQAVIRAALDKLGAPTKAGIGKDDALDDGALVRFAYQAADQALPHGSQNLLDSGMPIDFNHAAPGDLVFYRLQLANTPDALRVGLYLNRTTMLYASARRGQVVLQPIDNHWWSQRLLGVVSILSNE